VASSTAIASTWASRAGGLRVRGEARGVPHHDGRQRRRRVDPPGRRHRGVVADGAGEVVEADGRSGEQRVGGLDQRPGRALVGGQVDPPRAAGQHGLARAQVGGHVGAAERVDGLLGVADDREAAAGRAGDRRGAGLGPPHAREDLPLERIGVLELVDERPRQPRPQPGRERVAAGPTQQGGQPRQQVLVVELAACELVLVEARAQRRQEPVRDLQRQALQQRQQGAHAMGERIRRRGAVGLLLGRQRARQLGQAVLEVERGVEHQHPLQRALRRGEPAPQDADGLGRFPDTPGRPLGRAHERLRVVDGAQQRGDGLDLRDRRHRPRRRRELAALAQRRQQRLA
jgi:hypothetical protein